MVYASVDQSCNWEPPYRSCNKRERGQQPVQYTSFSRILFCDGNLVSLHTRWPTAIAEYWSEQQTVRTIDKLFIILVRINF